MANRKTNKNTQRIKLLERYLHLDVEPPPSESITIRAPEDLVRKFYRLHEAFISHGHNVTKESMRTEMLEMFIAKYDEFLK